MIIVENIKPYSVSAKFAKIGAIDGEDTENYDTLVTDAKLMLVDLQTQVFPKNIVPILISETEKIENRDWVLLLGKEIVQIGSYDEDTKLYRQNGTGAHFKKELIHKILALPEHFSPEQLQMIADGKLKDGKCLVECEKDEESMGKLNWLSKIKLNPYITIYPVKEKMYTREDVMKLIYQYDNDVYKSGGNILEFNTEEWFEQNVK